MKTLQEIEYETNFPMYQDYVPVNAACSNCGGQLYRNTSIVLTSYPPQHQYWCPQCGNIETSWLHLPEYQRKNDV